MPLAVTRDHLSQLPIDALKQLSTFLMGKEVASFLQTMRPLKSHPWALYEGRDDLISQLVVNCALKKGLYTPQEQAALLHVSPTIRNVTLIDKWAHEPSYGVLSPSKALAKLVVEQFKNMRALSCGSCLPEVANVFQQVVGQLTLLDVEGSVSFAELREGSPLTTLKLRESSFEEFMGALDHFSELETVELYDPRTTRAMRFNHASISAMAVKLPKLTSFTYMGGYRGDISAAFTKMQGLRSLGLFTTDKTCTAQTLERLKELPHLTSLALSMCSDVSVEVLDKAAALPLRKLNAAFPNELPAEFVVRFFSSVPHLCQLELTAASPEQLAAVQCCTSLEELVISFQVADRDMSWLASLQNMRKLEFGSRALSTSLVQALSKLPKLEMLKFRSLQGTVDWAEVAPLQHLRSLECSNVFGEKAEHAFSELLGKTNITHLKIQCMNFSAAYLPAVFAKATLRCLTVEMQVGTHLHPVAPLEDALLRFSSMTHLEELHITHAKLTDASWPIIEQLKAALPNTIVIVR